MGEGDTDDRVTTGKGGRLCTYYKPTVHFLQDLLLVECHGLPFPFLDAFLFQFLARIHLACGPHLAGTHLEPG